MGDFAFIKFHLWGEAAMWKHPSEALGHFSGAGPSPSNIGGILGAAMGMRSVPTKEKLRPVSEELLGWLYDNNVRVSSRTLSRITRISTNVNAMKALDEFQTFRLQRRSIDLPRYEVLVEVSRAVSWQLVDALRIPYYPVYLGDSNHLGKILSVQEVESPYESNWAYASPELSMEEYVWNTKFGTNSRLIREGYWNYPAPKVITGSPVFETCYVK